MKFYECTYCGMIKQFEVKPIQDSVLRCPICGERNCWEEKKTSKIKEVKNENAKNKTARLIASAN